MPDFKDDSRVPEEVKFHYSKNNLIALVVLLFIICVLFPTFLLIRDFNINSLIFSTLFYLLFVCHLYYTKKKLKYSDSVLIFSSKGIECEGDFLSWGDITNERMPYRQRITFFEYDHTWNNEIIETKSISIGQLKGAKSKYIKHIITIYRGRYEMTIESQT